MPKICYATKRFAEKSLQLIEQANDIIEEYQSAGFVLTLRQLYYQFVARDLIPNTPREYKRLGTVINDARLAGMVDWNAIEDRTRRLESLANWSGPESVLDAVASQFRYDKWEDQPYRVEVWIEKEALAGVFEGVCNGLQVPYLSCRGYGSQSVMWRAAMRLKRYEEENQHTLILHFGDHDPSGIDMTRDIRDRLRLFGSKVIVDRVALNMDQVEQYDPPPNPAKLTDTRAADYIASYGDSSWELDALEPAVLGQLVRDKVDEVLHKKKWAAQLDREEKVKQGMQSVSENWDQVMYDLGFEEGE